MNGDTYRYFHFIIDDSDNEHGDKKSQDGDAPDGGTAAMFSDDDEDTGDCVFFISCLINLTSGCRELDCLKYISVSDVQNSCL